MRVSTLCYATDSGLGILAKDFHRNGIVTDPVVVRHGHHPTHDEWYPGAPQITNLRDPAQLRRAEEVVRGTDVFLAFETYFHNPIVDFCRRHGIKVVLMPMHECHHNATPEPDQYWAPSLLDFCAVTGADEDFSRSVLSFCAYKRCVFTPVPVSVPWRLRERAEVFVHNAGHGGLKGRNGTREVAAALEYVTSPARFVIRSQSPAMWMNDPRVRYEGFTPYEDLWTTGDVFLFPEKWNGLSLPIQEAYASGMLVMAGARFPNTTYLPTEPLIPVDTYHRERVGGAYPVFDCAEFDPRTIAAHIDAWYGKDITGYSLRGKQYSEENSWTVLGPRYRALLEQLAGG